jgi:MGT family glycosyltransferase
MSKIVYFNIPAHGHVNPTLPVIETLVQAGEQVIAVNTEDWRSAYESVGATFRAYPTLPELTALTQGTTNFSFGKNALTLVQIAEKMMPDLLTLLRDERLDCVVFDSLASWGKQAADVLNIPVIGSVTTFVLGKGSMPSVSLPEMMKTALDLGKRMPAYWQTSARMQREHGIRPAGLINALMTVAAKNIVFTSAQFQPSGTKMGDAFQFVGPSIKPRPNSVDFPFDALTKKPVIYISLGTIVNTNTAFYQQCFSAFADFAGQVVLSVGKQTAIEALSTIPSNFIVRNFVPQLDVLQRADLFITHGGLNSVQEGLYYGLPLVVVPQQLEQAFVADQVVKHGAGVALSKDVTASELHSAADRILNNASYRAAAHRLRDSFINAGGYQRAADIIAAFAKQSSKVLV